MIEGSKKGNHQLAFELQNSHVCEKRSKLPLHFTERFCFYFMKSNHQSVNNVKTLSGRIQSHAKIYTFFSEQTEFS